MKKQTVKIKGEEYTVHSTTEAGVKEGIRQLKKSLKAKEKKEEKDAI